MKLFIKKSITEILCYWHKSLLMSASSKAISWRWSLKGNRKLRFSEPDQLDPIHYPMINLWPGHTKWRPPPPPTTNTIATTTATSTTTTTTTSATTTATTTTTTTTWRPPPPPEQLGSVGKIGGAGSKNYSRGIGGGRSPFAVFSFPF